MDLLVRPSFCFSKYCKSSFHISKDKGTELSYNSIKPSQIEGFPEDNCIHCNLCTRPPIVLAEKICILHSRRC